MAIGLIGRKAGMTRIFTDEGLSIPVTVVEIQNNRITQVRTEDVDGYRAIQVTVGERKASRVSKAAAGHFAKAGVEAGRGLWEFRLDAEEGAELKAGDSIDTSIFEPGQMIDVTGQSKGKGFQGVIKKYNFSMQDATHGNSLSHRAPGSIGMCQTPGRVFKGKKMSGHMGAAQVTVQSLEVVRVDAERNLLLIKGSVPGATGSDVIVKPAVKA
ncbi:MAG: large subunit ribosomal protein L3 [Oleiphilaceae bacterium]|jgi:large subunit ribosomal protein L3